MSSSDLQSPTVAAGSRPTGLSFSMMYGALSFAVVSMLAYSIWAFGLVRGNAAMYSTITAVYLAVSGLALRRLLWSPGIGGRFHLVFALAFLAYAIVWCTFWFGLKEKYFADLWGAALGLAGLTAILRRFFGAPVSFWKLFVLLFLLHSAGYYLGSMLHGWIRGSTGRMLFGVGHGLGFGAGLGWVLFHCQESVRNRFSTASVSRP